MILDDPEITARLFYPRRELGVERRENAQSVSIPVEEGIQVGGYLYETDPGGAEVVFFHGNGEIAADYDDLAPYFTDMGINFYVFDYRGYGRSNGFPSVSSMLADCHRIFDWVMERRKNLSHAGPLIVMGRSLGSASALELAYRRGAEIHGLIIESGFARTCPLLQLLGVDVEKIGIKEDEGLRHREKIASFTNPTLVIHAKYDSLIPLEEGKMLYEASHAPLKAFTVVPGADHNTIFAVGLDLYLLSVEWLVKEASRCKTYIDY